ncbi:hypothetical protein FNF28_07048 [Cafeteria roenbergensis]|uniref:Uncharacterized protein n=1 Tax=Cafeteria roenbergensis TaxID=33653 RepID=A0A5A8CH30_CAFRO|nr:hypothetical protein FNF28_07048 [Cafeteria roenbergensis]
MAQTVRGYELALSATGDRPRLEENAKGFRFPGPGWVRVKVAASAVTDENVAAMSEEAAAHSHWHGTVCSGVVEAATSCATADADPDALEWVPKRGDRVAVVVGAGAHASHLVCPWRCALPIPDSLPLAEAAALLASVVPAYLAVFGDGGMAPGARVAVLGAETPAGTAACQLLASMANTTVMAVCSNGVALGDMMRQGVDAAVAEADLPVPCWRSGHGGDPGETSGAAAWGRAVRRAVSAALRDELRSSGASGGSTGWDAPDLDDDLAGDAGSESSDAESASAAGSAPDDTAGGLAVDEPAEAGQAALRLGGLDADVSRGRVATPGHMRRRLINHHINTRTSVWDAYESMRELGVGMTGRVHLARHRRTGVLYAVKSIDLDKMAAAYLEELRSEIAFLTLLDHPNVITLYETFEDDTEGRLYLVLEYCSGGELFERLHEQKGSHFGEAHAAALVYQMLSAVAYCHRMGIAHRDLKLENFLLSSRDHDARVVLIDFGLSNRYAAGSGEHELADSLTNSAEQRGGTIRKMTTVLGTAYYTAPEILAKAPSYSEVCDVWSLGVIGYMLLSGSPPFRGRTDAEILERVRRGRYTLSTPVWQGVSDEAKSFVRACLKYNPERRPTAVECRRMAWFQRVAEQAASSPPGRRPDLDIVRAAMPVPVRAAALRRSIRHGALGMPGSGSPAGDDGAGSVTDSASNTPRAGGDTPLGAEASASSPAAMAAAGGASGVAGAASAGTDASDLSASGGTLTGAASETAAAAPASPTDDGFSALLARQIDPHVAAGLQDYAESSRLKRAALAAVAFSAAPEEVASLRDTFCALDSDGTGILSLRQIADALVRGSRPPIAREDADAMVTRFCADGQSVMGYSEFLAAAMPRSVLLSEPRLREAFGRLDADGTGFITVPTLRALMGDLYTDDELAGMIREADSDQDGRLSFQDFQGVVLGRPPVVQAGEAPGEGEPLAAAAAAAAASVTA